MRQDHVVNSLVYVNCWYSGAEVARHGVVRTIFTQARRHAQRLMRAGPGHADSADHVVPRLRTPAADVTACLRHRKSTDRDVTGVGWWRGVHLHGEQCGRWRPARLQVSCRRWVTGTYACIICIIAINHDSAVLSCVAEGEWGELSIVNFLAVGK